jgi:chromosome segregation ATPase
MIAEITSMDASAAMIKDKAAKITSTSQNISDGTRHIAKLKESYGDSEVVASMTQQQISNIFSSPTFAKFLECQEKIKQVEAKETGLNKEIDDEFSKISRPLGKYVYVTSLEKPLKAMLERLVASPSGVIMESKASIVTILESCMKGILSGAVSVKETDKSVDQITHIISLLDGFIKQKNEFQAQLEDLKKNVETIDMRQIEALEKRLAKAKSDKDDAKLKIANLESELKQQTGQKQTLHAELERMLEQILGTKYQVLE